MVKSKERKLKMNCRYCKSNDITPFCVGSDIVHRLSNKKLSYYRCKSCGSLFRDVTNTEDLSKYYPKNYAPYLEFEAKREFREKSKKKNKVRKLTRFRISFRSLSEWLERRAKKTISSLQKDLNYKYSNAYNIYPLYIREQSSVCDFGCGSPNTLSRIKQIQNNAKLHGVDITQHNEDDFLRIGATFETEEMFWKSSQQYNLINMNHVLEHVKDPEMLMNNIKSKLQPNGHLIMATPNAKSIWSWRFKNNWFSLDCPRHINIPTIKSLEILASKCGYQIILFSNQYRYNDYKRSFICQKAAFSQKTYDEIEKSIKIVPKSKLGSIFNNLGLIYSAYFWWVIAKIGSISGCSDRIITVMELKK